jgi:hypothetical protein
MDQATSAGLEWIRLDPAGSAILVDELDGASQHRNVWMCFEIRRLTRQPFWHLRRHHYP